MIKSNIFQLMEAKIYTSSLGKYWDEKIIQFSDKSNDGWQYIMIEIEMSDTQPIIGFGGCFTDSSAIIYKNLDSVSKKMLLESYFSPSGLNYSLGRVPMTSTDFSCRNNKGKPSLSECSKEHSVYNSSDHGIANEYNFSDLLFSSFQLQEEDLNYKIPMIRDALAINPQLKLISSPWSAPDWMKTNQSMVHGHLLSKYYQSWADYFINFFREYKKYGIIFWGLTVQNEPIKRGQSWQTMFSNRHEQAYFIKNFLGPSLAIFESEYGSVIKIIIHDDQIDTIATWSTMIEDPEVAKYVSGAGLHWYKNIFSSSSHLDKAYKILNKDKPRFILATEACEGYLPLSRGPKLNRLHCGEAYAHDIITDLNHHVSGWIDWNLVLDMKGGPNWTENYVDAPVVTDQKILYFQPMYYYLGHFSKFIKTGAMLLKSKSKGPFPLEQVSFRMISENGDAGIVIVVLNRDITGRKYFIQHKHKFLNLTIPPRSIQTIEYKT